MTRIEHDVTNAVFIKDRYFTYNDYYSDYQSEGVWQSQNGKDWEAFDPPQLSQLGTIACIAGDADL